MPFRKSKEWAVAPSAGVGIDLGAPLASGLIAAVPLNESAGQIITNYCGAQKLIGTASPTWVAGKLGPAASFVNASNQYFSDNTSSSVLLKANSGCSVSMWVNSPGTVNGAAINIGNSGSPRCLINAPNSSNSIQWGFPDFTNGQVTTSFTAYLNLWTHLACVSNGSNFRAIYINGALATSSTTSSSLGSTITGLWIGAAPFASQWHTGKMSNVKVWNRLLSQTEVILDYSYPWSVYVHPRRRIISQVVAAAGIAFDAAANSGDVAASANYTFTRTVAGSSRYLAIDIELLTVTGATVTSVTDDDGGGNVAAFFIGARATVTGAGRVECWGVIAPATGTKTIRIILSASIESVGTAVSYTGVNQTEPTEAFNSNQATNVGAADATVTITSISDNCWIHAACVANDTSITANQTTRNNVPGTLGSGANEDNNAKVTPAGATTMSYTNVAALATWAIAGYAIRPVADFAPAFRKTLSIVGGRVGARQIQG